MVVRLGVSSPGGGKEGGPQRGGGRGGVIPGRGVGFFEKRGAKKTKTKIRGGGGTKKGDQEIRLHQEVKKGSSKRKMGGVGHLSGPENRVTRASKRSSGKSSYSRGRE